MKLKLLGLIVPILAIDVGNVMLNRYNESVIRMENEMSPIELEYNEMISNLSNLPINFVYDGHYFKGLNKLYFKELKRESKNERNGVITTITLVYKQLEVKVVTGLYKNYNAYDYTVYFKNTSTKNSGVIKHFNNIDMNIVGEKPVLKGILGDHVNNYKPYEYNLEEENVDFVNDLGRATHIYFPYFNVENDNGGAMIAIGWGGSWEAHISSENGVTNFKGTSTNNLETYLKPGEEIRSALIGVVRYYERDEEAATNAWRRWCVECNLPKENAKSEGHIEPFTLAFFAADSDRPSSDGSIGEYYGFWENSFNSFYEHGLTADYRWFDAGWYFDPYGKTVPSDWWGTVGTWELDTKKWPDNSFNDSVEYLHERNTKTMVWFEPERVTHLDGMVKNYNYDRTWVLSDHGNNNFYINNLGNPDCLEWTTERILDFMSAHNVDLYREDFNVDPSIFWSIGDGYQGKDRKGITENLYMQGHYQLWDNIINYCAKTGKSTFVDSCASGGGRNDLESMRRSVPILRSDSDRTTTSLRLAYTQSLVKWIPFTGAASNESGQQLHHGGTDLYSFRASYLGSTYLNARYYHDRDTLNWDELKQGLNEFDEISKYVLKDFYNLTEYRGINNDREWVSYMYFDKDTNSGVIQAFRQANCKDESVKVCVKGVDPNKYYTLRDLDGINSLTKIKGSALQRGYSINSTHARQAFVIYIEEAK